MNKKHSMKFTKKTGYKFDRGAVKGFSFNTKEQFARMSAAWFRVNGDSKPIKSLNSDRLYFVLHGKGIFIIGDQKIQIKRKEIMIVPKNTKYSYFGNMECLLVNSPAFDKTKELRW